jgi:hypothetical protein
MINRQQPYPTRLAIDDPMDRVGMNSLTEHPLFIRPARLT